MILKNIDNRLILWLTIRIHIKWDQKTQNKSYKPQSHFEIWNEQTINNLLKQTKSTLDKNRPTKSQPWGHQTEKVNPWNFLSLLEEITIEIKSLDITEDEPAQGWTENVEDQRKNQ